MINDNAERRGKSDFIGRVLLMMLLVLSISIASYEDAGALPTGANITYNVTQTVASAPAGSLVTAGGSFTTLVLNGSFQTPRWKAYVGNVTGKLTLDDVGQKTIYDWNLVSISGEVYVSRNSTLTWSGVQCISNATLIAEQTYLNMTMNGSDNLNRTFNETVHRGFYVGTTQINQSSCRAIATYVNDSKQAPSINARFQEILLQDTGNNVIFSTLLESQVQGYNLQNFDFQMIVPENEYRVNPTPYYFYVEIS